MTRYEILDLSDKNEPLVLKSFDAQDDSAAYDIFEAWSYSDEAEGVTGIGVTCWVHRA